MSKPKLLRVFDTITRDTAYSKLNNYIEVTRVGQTIQAAEPLQISNNAMVTFKAPCSCEEVTSITINGISYNLVDASGEGIAAGSSFMSGSLISVTIDCEAQKAFIMNAAFMYDPDWAIKTYW